MIVIAHDYKKVLTVEVASDLVSFDSKLTIGALLYEFAKQYPDEIIIWCHEKVKEVLHLEYIATSFPHNRWVLSYHPYGNFFPDAIGYVEDSPFIHVNKKVPYPTWQMSSYVGAIKAQTVLLTDLKFWNATDFDFCLNVIAKTYQPIGLFCYSDPKLVNEAVLVKVPKASYKQLFTFVNQHYKKTWVYLLMLNLLLYEKKFPVLAFLATFFPSKKIVSIKEIHFEYTPSVIDLAAETIDVIIPTIGRKTYLYDVLCDLKAQTHLPQNVIIVEQNPLLDSVTELDYITNEEWPFAIKHIFTHQTGACQARNKALPAIESKWCFLADDDIVFSNDFLKEALKQMVHLKVEAGLFSCLLKNQIKTNVIVSQTTIFGSGCSLVSSSKLKDVRFDEKLEFGYGEDTEFGMQLRHAGTDVVYLPFPEITHLKAPIGGFRTKFTHPWEMEHIQPKPSPTVLYYRMKYYSTEQIKGYKTSLFLKFYKDQSIKNPFLYFKRMKARWEQSIKWTIILLQKNEV